MNKKKHEMIKMQRNLNDLKRFDFTPECKTCQFKKDLGLLEYCCSFVMDMIRKERFDKMKDKVYDYMHNDDDLNVIDTGNVLFQNDTEFSVTLTFQTNLREDKKLILKQLREAVMDSMYFNHVNFKKDTLTKKEYSKEAFILQSTIDKYMPGDDNK